MGERPSTSKFRFPSDSFGTFGTVVLVLCLLLALGTAVWQYRNRARLARTFDASVEFILAPDTARAGQAARFVVHVGRSGKPAALPERIVNFAVSPPDRARILSVSGSSGRAYAKTASQAQGKTDAAGNVALTVEAAAPGEYTLVALDSASEREGTVNFRVLPPEG